VAAAVLASRAICAASLGTLPARRLSGLRVSSWTQFDPEEGCATWGHHHAARGVHDLREAFEVAGDRADAGTVASASSRSTGTTDVPR
jgi:hypothetical protein